MTQREEYCLHILMAAGLPERTRAHCRAVGALAKAMAEAMVFAMDGNTSSKTPDASLCYRGGLLHDIRRNEHRHADAGAAWLLSLGLREEARICALHNGEDVNDVSPDEAAVVCLADKLVRGVEFVGIDDRFALAGQRFKNDPEVRELMARRREKALRTLMAVEARCGVSALTLWRGLKLE